MLDFDPQASVDAAGYFQQALEPVRENHSSIMMTHFKPHGWARCGLHFGGRWGRQ